MTSSSCRAATEVVKQVPKLDGEQSVLTLLWRFMMTSFEVSDMF